MYFISENHNEMLDIQAHEESNPKIIKHPKNELYAIKISKGNICEGMTILKKIPVDWGC